MDVAVGVITVDSTSPVPPFEQVRMQFAAQITDGILAVGAKLPTVRRLAEDLGLAVNTVARAYRELEAAGLVETHGRAGTVVAAGGDGAKQRLQAAAQTFAKVAHDVGIAPDRALEVARAALARP